MHVDVGKVVKAKMCQGIMALVEAIQAFHEKCYWLHLLTGVDRVICEVLSIFVAVPDEGKQENGLLFQWLGDMKGKGGQQRYSANGSGPGEGATHG